MSDTALNKTILENAYRLWHDTRGGSVDHWMSLIANEVTFGSLAEGAAPAVFTARRLGKDAVRGYFQGLTGGWAMDYYRIDCIVAEGDRCVAVGATCWTHKTTGKKADTPKVDVFRFENGRIVEFYEYYDTAKMFAAATAV